MVKILSFDDFKNSLVLPSVGLLGGKGNSLVKLGLHQVLNVPKAFFVTTEAFREILFSNEKKLLNSVAESLSRLINEKKSFKLQESKLISEVAEEIRLKIQQSPLSIELKTDIEKKFTEFQQQEAESISFAVRSSGIGEDSAEHSFAGQYDTYLNIGTIDDLYHAISSCYASLFTERALSYRLHNGLMDSFLNYGPESKDFSWIPLICVVCQIMIESVSSGVMFTADPLTSNRRLMSIDCSYGLGEAIVSGIVNPDTYKVKKLGKYSNSLILKEFESNLNISFKKIGKKEKMVCYSSKDDKEHTEIKEIDENIQTSQTLSDGQILALSAMGIYIENVVYQGIPQDIEYGFDKNGIIHILQSRAITTLFPIPTPVPMSIFQSLQEMEQENKPKKEEQDSKDDWLSLYFSFGHVQVMTQGARLLGLSTMQHACEKAYEVLHSHVDGDKRFLDAGGHWYFDFSDLLGIAPNKMKTMLAAKGGHKAGLSMQIFAKDEEKMKRIRPSGWKVGFQVLKMYYTLGIISPETIRCFFKQDIKDEMEDYHKKMNGIVGDLIEKRFRKLFVEKSPQIDNQLKEKLMNRFENGSLYDPVFGNIIDLQKVLEERMPKLENDKEKAKFFQRCVENLISELKEVMFVSLSSSIIPCAPAFAYCMNLERIFEETAGESEKKTTKELISELMTGLNGNITTEMDFQIADLADLVQKYPNVADYLRKEIKNAEWDEYDEEFVLPPQKIVEGLTKQDPHLAANGGKQVADEIIAFIQAFGFRGPMEIDVSNNRYAENLYLMLQAIVGPEVLNPKESEKLENHESRRQKFEKLKLEGDLAAEELKKRTKHVGFFKNLCTFGLANYVMNKIGGASVNSVRYGLGKRESPKYYMIKILWEFKLQIMLVADFLLSKGILQKKSQIFHFSLAEIRDILESCSENKISTAENMENQNNFISIPKLQKLLKNRQAIHKKFKHREPSSLLTSDGEELDVLMEQFEMERMTKENKDCGSMNFTFTGLGVSKGVYIGPARVVQTPQEAGLNEGEILVARFTDPGWTPLFTRANAVVLEVGGFLTHGSVIAREMGLPAVVGVTKITSLVKTGQFLEVNGNTGMVKVLTEEEKQEFLKKKKY